MNLIHKSHAIWQGLLGPKDYVIDATCGNGYDTLFLAKCVDLKRGGKVFAFDIQEKALVATKQLLTAHFSPKTVEESVCFLKQCHSSFPPFQQKVKLIVYNLGYLPGGGNKTLTTCTHSTLKSLESALNIVSGEGVVSVMCYPGHEEGKKELKGVLYFCKALNSKKYLVKNYISDNKIDSPSLFIIKNILF